MCIKKTDGIVGDYIGEIEGMDPNFGGIVLSINPDNSLLCKTENGNEVTVEANSFNFRTVDYNKFIEIYGIIQDETEERCKDFSRVEDVEKYLNSKDIPKEEHFKYVWSYIDDGEGGLPFQVNGWHPCNNLEYNIGIIPWTDNTANAENEINIIIPAD